MFIFIEGIKLPVNPEEIKLEDKQGIETVAIIDTGNVPLVGNPDLQSESLQNPLSPLFVNLRRKALLFNS